MVLSISSVTHVRLLRSSVKRSPAHVACFSAGGVRSNRLRYGKAEPHTLFVERRSVIPCAGKVQKLTGEELEAAIGDRNTPMIVDFFATWCGPCVMLAKELEQVAEQLGDAVKIVKVDVDENSQLASALRIEGLPTIIFIPKDNEKPALRTEGLLPAQQIIEIVKEL